MLLAGVFYATSLGKLSKAYKVQKQKDNGDPTVLKPPNGLGIPKQLLGGFLFCLYGN